MAARRDFLLEIGTEELPPRSLLELSASLASALERGFAEAGLAHGFVERFASPRRLAVRVRRLSTRQPDREQRRTGPSVAVAFDAAGQPTRAAIGFATSCGTTVEALERTAGPKGPVLTHVAEIAGQNAAELLPGLVARAIDALPIARRMRWGAGEVEFVRPVHWILMLLGSSVVPGSLLGLPAGAVTFGHRFHAPRMLRIASPGRYESVLRSRGWVIADAAERRERIRAGVTELGSEIGGEPVIPDALLDEVTALVEWPVPLAGRFDERFLELPAEVLIATMQDHQRYFPVRDRGGSLLPWFIAVANLESRDPAVVRAGNERVIRPRLADAAFFWETDRRRPLITRLAELDRVVFEARLGSLGDKTRRVRKLVASIAPEVGADLAAADRAAELAKCDLVCSMVGEFPELQGTMGTYYARLDGESEAVAGAIAEHYLPRFAGDHLPTHPIGIAVAIADRLDTLVGIFAIGQKPTGTRDPYGLRRGALGILRILVEQRIELDFVALLETAAAAVRRDMSRVADGPSDHAFARDDSLVADVYDYVMERLRSYYLDGRTDGSVTTEMFDAVLATRPRSPLDFDARLKALRAFLALPDAASLAAANKRIQNILRKANAAAREIDDDRLVDPAERILAEQVVAIERQIAPLRSRREYTELLRSLAVLRPAVDGFFEDVMVMVEDQAVRDNRLALLTRLSEMFQSVADLSRLSS